MKLFESERLYLREFNLMDAESFYKLNSDFQVVKYTGDIHFEPFDFEGQDGVIYKIVK